MKPQDPMDRFVERQRFTSPWLWAVLLIPAVLFSYGAWRQFVQGEPWGSNPAGDTVLLAIVFFAVLILPGFFALMELRTRVSSDGIHLRFFPLHLKERSWRFDELDLIEAREYSPLKEYGGWGIRLGPGGTAYNVKGRQGIQLVLRSGRRILIGTQDPEGFLAAVQEILEG